ncbi:NAD(P)-binding protein [Rubrobacter marinus]|uniref:NAD(P)-binding protein n=1 Tax=Rubrobacter marinus TaxID=2653852 RepID=A0A6G8Q0E5_9ACTN|nr:NAD(P)/FAD-dependent oxidoreductase [Rubrobacter marinus]QIN79900.1 NAD(P)-binding protein [Rubrobacter marinus]
MSSAQQNHPQAGTDATESFDAVVVGAGFAGLYALHKLRDEMGLSARVYEAGGGIGGTWYWNRYPGARSDTSSWIYCYSFDEELLQEWQWSERYPQQQEVLNYLEHVAERFDLNRDIQLQTRVTSAIFDEETERWEVRTDTGDVVSARFVIAALGALSAANLPDVPGLESFAGDRYHTAEWPHEGVDFTGKKVGLIGTGATGIQVATEIAEEAEHLTVFQRTPNYAVPLGNHPLDAELRREYKENYDEIWEQVRHNFSGHDYEPIGKTLQEAAPEERERAFQERYDRGGFGLWLANYDDLLENREANAVVSEWVRERIRERVRDPETAEKLTPSDHAFGTKRVPLENGYYEIFNRDNVGLVDVKKTPIEEITATGVRTQDGEYEFDALVFATGFDAMTGPYNKIDIRGRGGRLLRDKWAEGPRTYLGIMSAGFPNMFAITGPQSPSVLTNMPVAIEQHVEWISGIVRHMLDNGLDVVEPTLDAEDEWVDHSQEVAHATLLPESATWYMGANIPGKPQVFLPYLGGLGPYREKCDEVAKNAYEGFAFANREETRA